MSQFSTIVVCPYCDVANRVSIELTDSKYAERLVNCDRESGGCDNKFVVFFRIKITTDERKIEGFEGFEVSDD